MAEAAVTFDCPEHARPSVVPPTGAVGEGASSSQIPSTFQCEQFSGRFSAQECFLGSGREKEAEHIIDKSGQSQNLYQSRDSENPNQRVFVKHCRNTDKTNKDVVRELAVCSKMVQHREHIRSTAGAKATDRAMAFDHLGLPMAACVCPLGGYLIASPLVVDKVGNQAEDLMAALTASPTWPEITAARTDETALRRLIKPLFTAVHQMHILNIAHRDIKPDNVLVLRSEMELVLIDFGHSKHVVLPGVRAASGHCGTVGWVPWNAHDVYHKSAGHDPLKIDVFSLAQLLIAILFLKAPVGASVGNARNIPEMTSTATAAEIQAAMTKDQRDILGVPLDRLRPGLPPLSQSLRDLLGSMLIQGNDNQRLSMRGALQHDWFLNDDPTDTSACTRQPSAGDVSGAGRAPYETALTEQWHVMTAHPPVELIHEYPCKDAVFQDTYNVDKPWGLAHDLIVSQIGRSIQHETLERARAYGMEYYTVKMAKPYIEVTGFVLNALQAKFPDAVPLWNDSAPSVAPQGEFTQFVRSCVHEGTLKPLMYRKSGAFARKLEGSAGNIQQTMETPTADNPYCFSFHAPWMKHDSRGNQIGPATCDLALGDFLGIILDPEDPSLDHVWKLSQSWFHGKANLFCLDLGETYGTKRAKEERVGRTSPRKKLKQSETADAVAAPAQMDAVLESLGLSKLLEQFEKEEIDTEALQMMGDEDLKEIGISKGPRLKLRKWINENANQ